MLLFLPFPLNFWETRCRKTAYERVIFDQISSILHLPRSTVIYTLNPFKETGNHNDTPKSGRHNIVSTSKNINKIQKRLKCIPRRSMRKIAVNFESVRKSIRHKSFGNATCVLFGEMRNFSQLKSPWTNKTTEYSPRESSKLISMVIISRTQHPVNVMVWVAITSDGKSPLVFVQGVKINAEVYKKYFIG